MRETDFGQPEVQAEWDEVRASAMAEMRDFGKDRPEFIGPRLFWVFRWQPRGDATAWIIRGERRAGSIIPSLAMSKTWRVREDSLAFLSAREGAKDARPFKPTFEVLAVADDDPGDRDEALRALMRTPIGLFDLGSGLGGRDGDAWEMEIGFGLQTIRLAWHQELPEPWKPLAQPLNRLMARLGSMHLVEIL
jgi:hypothetical protein